jgi:hypothetical protein
LQSIECFLAKIKPLVNLVATLGTGGLGQG